MTTQPLFEDLLPTATDPTKIVIREKLVKVLNSEGELLPPASSPRGQLWRLVNTPDASIDECAEVVMLDSALASRIVRVANSGAYGKGASDITAAIQRLGMKFVREQVFNAGIFEEYSDWSLPPEWGLFWLRNVFTARLCEKISGRYSPTNGSEYLAGLIHDMGWLFMATYLQDEYLQIFSSGKPIGEAEKEILPCTHAEISAALAARSMLADRAVDAILYHHDPAAVRAGAHGHSDKSAYFLALILNVCDGVADNCGLAMFGEATRTLEDIQDGPDVQWLNNFGAPLDIRSIAEEELDKSKQIFDAFFATA